MAVAKRGSEMSQDNRREQIRRLRDIAGLSQFKLARLSGVARNRISQFECGYVQLQDEEYSLVEHAIRDVLVEKRQGLSTALSPDLESARKESY